MFLKLPLTVSISVIYIYIYICIHVYELLMGFLDEASQPSRTSLSITFLKHCGRGDSLGITMS